MVFCLSNNFGKLPQQTKHIESMRSSRFSVFSYRHLKVKTLLITKSPAPCSKIILTKQLRYRTGLVGCAAGFMNGIHRAMGLLHLKWVYIR